MIDNDKQNRLISKLDDYIKDNISVFNIDKIDQNKLINFIYKHFNRNDICSILLRGSCATGRQNYHSDIDLLVLYEGENKTIVIHDEDNLRYHITLLNKSIKVCYDDVNFRYYYGMKTIYDPIGIGKKMIEDMYQYEIYSNAKLIKQDSKYKDYMYYLKSFINDDDIIQAKYAKAKLLYNYPMILSLYNGYTFIGDRPTIDCLIRDNYELSLIYAKALLKSSTIQDIEYLLDNSFNPLCNINPLDTNFNDSKKSFEIYADNTTVYDLFSNYKYFFIYINCLKDVDQTGLQFILECKEKTPELFNKLWSLIS